jgi:hypothetical protein
MGMGCNCGQWEAWRNRMPGDDPDRGKLVRVSGTCQCDIDGYEITLAPTNEGIKDDPSLIALRCVIKAPEAGATVMTEEAVNWEGAAEEAVTRIRIDCGGDSTFVEIRDAQ